MWVEYIGRLVGSVGGHPQPPIELYTYIGTNYTYIIDIYTHITMGAFDYIHTHTHGSCRMRSISYVVGLEASGKGGWRNNQNTERTVTPTDGLYIYIYTLLRVLNSSFAFYPLLSSLLSLSLSR